LPTTRNKHGIATTVARIIRVMGIIAADYSILHFQIKKVLKLLSTFLVVHH
jgi:hypothetical protein